MKHSRTACRVLGRLAAAIALLCSGTVPAAAADGISISRNRWGVCVHSGAPDFERQLDRIRDAGIGWIRCDFFWDSIQPRRGVFDFKRSDRVVEQARRRGIQVLPILDYSSRWAGRAWEHLDLWQAYVEATVRRYSDRVRAWEIWNEENGGFWTPRGGNPVQYARLLAASQRTIKRIDPRIQVLYGGLIGTGVDFVRRSLDAGAAGCFDALAFHPYCQPRSVRSSGRLEEFMNLKHLLELRSIPPRFWITEIGWPTTRRHGPPAADALRLWRAVLRAAVHRAFPGRKAVGTAVLADPDFSESFPVALAFAGALRGDPTFSPVRRIRLRDLDTLSPAQTPVLAGLFGETFPLPAFPAMVRFVRRGGLLAHFGGVPLYYAFKPTQFGGWRNAGHSGDDRYRRRLHIGWEAWWIHHGLPKSAPEIRPAPGIEDADLAPRRLQTQRWFTSGALAPGDRMIPILEACDAKGRRVAYPAVLYRLGSDLHGSVLVAALPGPGGRPGGGISEELQARYAVRAYLTWASMGVEKIFWYDFRDDGTDPDNREHRFGLMDPALQPKPAYRAIRTMIRLFGPAPRFARPARRLPDTDIYAVDAIGAGGTPVRGLWSDAPDAVLAHPPKAKAVLDCYGKPIAGPAGVKPGEAAGLPVGRYGLLYVLPARGAANPAQVGRGVRRQRP